MTDAVRTPRPERSAGAELLRRLTAPGTAPPPSFALLHRPASTGGGALEVLIGRVEEVERLADLPLPESGAPAAGGPQDLVVVVPYRQVRERGFDCRDDGEPLLALVVTEQATVPLEEAQELLPAGALELGDLTLDVGDDEYADLVRRVLRDEIGRGSGSNFVLQRAFQAVVPDYSHRSALTLFRNLLTAEAGAYWTFVVHTGTRTFVGASPERHVSLEGKVATMNPISGTLRYPPGGPSVAGALEFLADAKETDELYMVVDEELKMMAGICEEGGRVIGPYLKEMARVAHTEYLIAGRSRLDVREMLRATMFAPTVTGSPLENACRVIARQEPAGRGYYSGVLALIGRDAGAARTLDSAILIRTADIDDAGRLTLRVGATLVRHSDPATEVLETRAKAAGLLAAARGAPVRRDDRAERAGGLGSDPRVRAALESRNDRLAPFWLRPATLGTAVPALLGRRVLVVDAEDTFTAMLGHQLRALGLVVDVRSHRTVVPACVAEGYDLVLVGPGPGDPQEPADPKIATLRAVVSRLLADRTPFLAVCLGHQVLSTALGLPLVRKTVPSQGQQREIDWFGRPERVGFYNTFVATSASSTFSAAAPSDPVLVSRDERSGEVHGLRGAHFASAQFHPESVLTADGPGILADGVLWSLGVRPAQQVARRRVPEGTIATPRRVPVGVVEPTPVARLP
ncbi:phenazine-specific anthranilate synthase component I [Blastococcus sp. KM273128]|uniref:anthranilate synthase family protein n=1 Tax=Blastococcus sp. KM273128 TaxID=2570314 RepID=UPI002714F621|nr:anthranilate synthase family protein [Blastococcus sp. KM273128]MCF6744059.1 phenazine-specific anthranilate synthase component I [Blastococcus sp. KM273128]